MPKVKSQRYWCVAEGCNADDRKRGKYGFMDSGDFFPFPTKAKDPKLRKKWLNLLRRKNYEPKYHHRLCSLHFVDGRPTSAHPYPELFAYNNYKQTENIRSTTSIMKGSLLRCDANQTDESPDHIIAHAVRVTIPLQIADADIVPEHQIPVTNEETVTSEMGSTRNYLPPDELADHNYLTLPTTSTYERKFADAGVQTDMSVGDISGMEEKLNRTESKDDLLRDLVVDKVTKCDKNVQNYLGIPSIAILFGLFGLLDRISPDLSYWNGQNTKKHSEKKKRAPNRKLTRFHEYILTLMRLRLGLVSFILGDLFGISCSLVSQIFTTWINYMNSSVFSTTEMARFWKSKKNYAKKF